MAEKDLSFFMRDQVDEIVDVPAPPSFKGPDGKPVMMQVKRLSAGTIQKINKAHRHESMGFDSKTRRPYSENGRILKKDDTDYERSGYALVAEALVYPDPKSQKLRDYYKAADPIEVLFSVFRTQAELNYVVEAVLDVLGLRAAPAEEEIEEVKNG
jgi:hypothetical protein